MPLPAGVRYLRRTYQPNHLLPVVLAVPFLFGLIMALRDLIAGRWQAENGAILAVLVAPFAVLMEVQRRQRHLERELGAGTRRLGLFLGAEELLVAMRPGEGSLLPRARLQVKTVEVHHGKTSSLELELVAGGQVSSLVADDLCDFSGKHQELVALLEAWARRR